VSDRELRISANIARLAICGALLYSPAPRAHPNLPQASSALDRRFHRAARLQHQRRRFDRRDRRVGQRFDQLEHLDALDHPDHLDHLHDRPGPAVDR
jgi:hypothetical protein